jgi:hypothetical protein
LIRAVFLSKKPEKAAGMVSRQKIRELQALLHHDRGLDLPDTDADLIANQLTSFFEDLVYGEEQEE